MSSTPGLTKEEELQFQLNFVLPRLTANLEERGWTVVKGPADSLFLVSPRQRRFQFWMVTKWYEGPTRGHGLQPMIHEGEMPLAELVELMKRRT